MAQDIDEYKCREPSITIHEEEEEKYIFNEDNDPSISDIEHSKSMSPRNPNRLRTKSKSSGDVLLQSKTTKKPSFKSQRRHSESSSESHSSDYRKKHQSSKSNKMPILIPLNVNGKNLKRTPSVSSKKGSSKSPSKRTFGRSILSKYKLKKNQIPKMNDDEKSNVISGPVNVQHIIHVEWDAQSKAYKGIPDVWHSSIPQSFTVPTQELPVQFRENRSISLTQSMLQSVKSSVKDANNASSSPIDYMDATDSLVMPLPGPRVFINSLNKKKETINDINLQIPDFHGLLCNQVMTISDYLKRIGIDDLNKQMSVSQIRKEFFVKMGFSKRDPLINIPRHIQQQILTYLDIKSYLRCCITCSDMASFLDDPIIWKVQVLYKSKVQGTLHKTDFRLRHRIWKATYMSMVKIDQNPSYYDYVWNIVVAGDTKSGQNRLVVSLGRHWRCKLTGLEPVISAVNGTYRFGVDFVIRRVIIRDIIIKLQVWDGGHVMTDTSLLKSVNIFLILFDLTKKDSFDRTLNVARSMISLLPQNLNNGEHDRVKLMMVGNTTNNANERVVSYEAAKRFANERGLMYIEANTDSTQNDEDDSESINKAFVNLAEECIAFENEKAALKSQHSTKDSTNCLIQ